MWPHPQIWAGQVTNSMHNYYCMSDKKEWIESQPDTLVPQFVLYGSAWQYRLGISTWLHFCCLCRICIPRDGAVPTVFPQAPCTRPVLCCWSPAVIGSPEHGWLLALLRELALPLMSSAGPAHVIGDGSFLGAKVIYGMQGLVEIQELSKGRSLLKMKACSEFGCFLGTTEDCDIGVERRQSAQDKSHPE